MLRSIVTAWSFIKGRTSQVLAGAPGGGIAIAGAVILFVVGALVLRASIIDAAIAGRDVTWASKLSVETAKATRADADRKAAILQAAEVERAKAEAANSRDVERRRALELEAEIQQMKADPVCIPKRSK